MWLTQSLGVDPFPVIREISPTDMRKTIYDLRKQHQDYWQSQVKFF